MTMLIIWHTLKTFHGFVPYQSRYCVTYHIPGILPDYTWYMTRLHNNVTGTEQIHKKIQGISMSYDQMVIKVVYTRYIPGIWLIHGIYICYIHGIYICYISCLYLVYTWFIFFIWNIPGIPDISVSYVIFPWLVLMRWTWPHSGCSTGDSWRQLWNCASKEHLGPTRPVQQDQKNRMERGNKFEFVRPVQWDGFTRQHLCHIVRIIFYH